MIDVRYRDQYEMHSVAQGRKGGNQPLKSFYRSSSTKRQHQVGIEWNAIGAQCLGHCSLVLYDKNRVIQEDARSVRRELSRRYAEMLSEVRGKRRTNVGNRH